ncbi:MAG: glutathione-disulfide reductase [Microcystaceae cyanobacterium]
MAFDFDLFVIGAGSGGIATARRSAEYGAKVGIAEFDRLGGTCVNRGCVPKKLLVYASRFADQFVEAKGYGWSPINSSCDWPTLITDVNDEVHRLNTIYQKMLDNSSVQVLTGFAHFIDPHTIEIAGKTITADRVLIAVGGEPFKPDIAGIEHFIVSDDLFNLKELPKHLVILGGGYIGVEFACVMHNLGSQVTMIIRRDKILRGFDDDIREEIQTAMERRGIRIINNDHPQQIEKTATGLKITLEKEVLDLPGAIGLAATGRKAKLDKLGLDLAGVTVENEAIMVNDFSQTSQPNIYAVGDCTNRINLTPVAINEGRAFADTEFGGKHRLMSHENVPSAIFSTPEAATVGLTEQEAIAKYGTENIKTYRCKFRPMYYVLPDQENKTLMKLVIHLETDRVLGAHMVGDGAAEIIQGMAIAVKMGAKKSDFDATIGIHPTAAEEFVTLR